MERLGNFFVTFQSNFNGSAIYHPGETISGSVIAVLNDSMELKTLKVKFVGKANVSWIENHSNGNSNTAVRYSSREIYFDRSISVFGQGSGGRTQNLTKVPAGQNTFPFRFRLPANLPSSFEGRYGHVRYTVKASIIRPWTFDYNTKAAFTVLDLLDLNQEQAAKNPTTRDVSKTICCWCCASSPIEVEVSLPRTGYVPGEFIPVCGKINNYSSYKLPRCKAILLQRVVYHAHSPYYKTRKLNKYVAVVGGPGCDSKKSMTWNREQLQIPPLPPSGLRHCRIMNIEYYVQFVTVLPRLHDSLCVKVPILIGAIPLTSETSHHASQPPSFDTTVAYVGSAAESPTLPETLSSPLAPPPPSYASAISVPPPPSYASAISGPPRPSFAFAISAPVNIADEDDNKYLMGNKAYTPQYAYYG